MKHLLWLSQHQPLARQVKVLENFFGEEVNVVWDSDTFTDAEELEGRFRGGGYHDLMVVAPLSVIQRLCDLGLTPLWGEMKEVSPEEAEVTTKGRHYRFVRFRRVDSVVVNFDPTFDAEYGQKTGGINGK